MCGRFALTVTPEEVLEFLSLSLIEDFPPRYNIAPTQPILLVIEDEGGGPGSNQPKRKAMLARWGLIPGWVKDPKDFPLLLNARSETAISKASFRAAMRHRRILVPASGFYEWHRPSKESGETSQAYWVRPKRGGLVAFAGLMETFASADGSEIDTAAILTVASNPTFMPIHDRMPVVIQPEDFSRWLDCKTQEPREVADLMSAPQEDLFEAIPVSNLVNKVANTGPEIQARMDINLSETRARKSSVQKTVQKSKSASRTPPDDDRGGGQMDLF
jgi:putative SOS response-associated peptidase YedK